MRHTSTDPNWHLINYDPVTFKSTYMKIDEGLMTFRTTIPEWLALQIIEKNKREANEWQASGGWRARKFGGVVASIPEILDTELKKKSGYDPRKGGFYDQDKYNSFLDDIDYRHLRTGGGKIGKRKAAANGIQSRLKKLILPATA